MRKILLLFALIGLCLIVVSPAAAILSSNVWFYMPGNGTAGSTAINDWSQYNQRHLPIIFGGTQVSVATPKFGSGAVYFDGNGDEIHFTNSSDFNMLHNLTQSWSIAFWANRTRSAADNDVFDTADSTSAQHGVTLEFNSSSYLNIQFMPGDSIGSHIFRASAGSTPLNKWSYFVLSYNVTSKQLKTYTNGTLYNTYDLTSWAASYGSGTNSHFIFGMYDDTAGSAAYQGLVDDFVVYNGIVLDGTQVPAQEFFISGGSSELLASFTQSTTQIRNNTAISFTDTSSGSPTTWNWSFSDGTANATTQNPSHIFNKNGIFGVQLTVTNATGASSSINTNIFVNKTFVVIGDSTARGLYNGREDCNSLTGCTGNGVVWNASYIPDNATYTGELQNNYTANVAYWGNRNQYGSGYNMGMAGQQLSNEVVTRWPRDALGYSYSVGDNITTGYGILQTIPQMPDIILIGGGINDVTAGASTTTFENAMYNNVKNATQNNISVIVVDIFPNSGYTSTITTWNSWELINLTNLSTSNATVRVYDAYAFLNDGSGNIKSPYSAGDGKHLTTQGYIDMTKQIWLQDYDLFGGSLAPTLPVASFTCTPTSTTLGTPIACTDTSTGSPTNWIYYWNDGTISTTQNPSHIYGSVGTYSVNQTVNNSAGKSWYNRSNYIIITNASGFTQQDLWQTGHYTKTLHIVDSSNAPIPVVTVTDSNGQSYTTTNGTAYFTEYAGVVIFYFASTGYVSKSMSYVIDGDSTDTVQMVTAGTSSNPSIVYIPQQVRFQLIGTDGTYLSNVFIQATPINFTAPANWTETLLGISPGVGIRDTTVYGTTGSDGSWVAPMLQSFQYQINLTRVSDINYNFTLYPEVTEYRFMIPVAGYVPITTPTNVVSYSLQNATINESSTVMFQFINMTYNDGSLNTDKLSFVVYDVNNTLIYSQNYTGTSANAQNFSYVQRCANGQAYTYGFQANQSAYGWINQSSTIKLMSQVNLLAGGPAWITQWFAIAMIVIFGALFMIFSKAYALVGIPFLTWAFQYVFGFLPATFLSNVALLCMLTIGVMVYIRQAENKIQ